MPNSKQWVQSVIDAETRRLAAAEIRDAIGTVGEKLLNKEDMANMVQNILSGPGAKALRQKAKENVKKEAAMILATIGQMKGD